MQIYSISSGVGLNQCHVQTTILIHNHPGTWFGWFLQVRRERVLPCPMHHRLQLLKARRSSHFKSLSECFLTSADAAEGSFLIALSIPLRLVCRHTIGDQYVSRLDGCRFMLNAFPMGHANVQAFYTTHLYRHSKHLCLHDKTTQSRYL